MGICIFFAYISHLFIFYLGTLNTYHVIFILVTFWRVLYFILMGCILIPLGVAGMSVCFTTNVTRLGYFGMSWQQIFKAKVAQTFVDIWIFIYSSYRQSQTIRAISISKKKSELSFKPNEKRKRLFNHQLNGKCIFNVCLFYLNVKEELLNCLLFFKDY